MHTEVGGWREPKVTPLKDPIGEFNARGGVELSEYLSMQDHLVAEHPNIGREKWAEIEKTIPHLDFLCDPLTGQKLRVHKFNWPSNEEALDSQPVSIFNTPFSVPIDLKHLVYQHSLIAQALGSPFMVVENPGYGNSDKLLPYQKHELRRGKFGSIGEAMLRMIQSDNISRFNCIGYSMGSDTACAIAANAAKYSLAVRDLFIMESPRVEKQNPVRLAINFARDTNNLRFSWNHPIDPVLREVAKLEIGLPKGLFTYGRALYKGGLEEDLVQGLSNQPDMKLTIGRAGSSRISLGADNYALYTRLKTQFPERSIRQVIIPGESHAYGDSGNRYANLVRLMLRNT